MPGLGGVLGGLGVLWLLTATTLRALGGRSRWNLHPRLFLNGFGGGASVAVVGLLMWSVR
jgi:hypothetical protein